VKLHSLRAEFLGLIRGYFRSKDTRKRYLGGYFRIEISFCWNRAIRVILERIPF
jgi:hypothetical protein